MEVLDQDLQSIIIRNYNRAYFWHPEPFAAFQVLLTGIKIAANTKRKISRRTCSDDPHKFIISDRDLLHYGIMEASELYETYEEHSKYTSQKNLSRYQSEYEPNADDFLIRYLKKIYLSSYDRHPRYFAIAEGTQFYRYRTVDILKLSDDFDNQNSSDIKKFVADKIARRFCYLDLEEMRPVADVQRTLAILQTARRQLLLPSQREYGVPNETNLALDYFGFQSSKPLVEKQTVLMTYGIGKLISDYNRCFSAQSSERLDEPNLKIRIPEVAKTNFSKPTDDFESRLQPVPLDRKDWLLIEQNLKNNLAWLKTDDTLSGHLKFIN